METLDINSTKMWVSLKSMTRQKKKILKKIWIGLAVIFLLWIILTAVYFFTKVEKPNFSLPLPEIQNYSGSYDLIDIKNVWVSFEAKAGGEIQKDPRWMIIQYPDGDYITFYSQKIADMVISHQESLKSIAWTGLTYETIENVQINPNYPELFEKKRNDTYLNGNWIVRMLDDVKFDLNRHPITTIERITGDAQVLQKTFLELYKNTVLSQYNYPEVDLEEGMNVKNGANVISGSWWSSSLIAYNVMYNIEQTRAGNYEILDEVTSNYYQKYNYKLSNEDIEYFKNKILDQANYNYKKLRIIYYYLDQWQMFRFSLISTGKKIALQKILNWDFNSLFIREIQFQKADTSLILGEQKIFHNLYYNLPDIFTQEEDAVNGDFVMITPYIYQYRYGKIKLYFDKIEGMDRETILSQNQAFYTSNEYKLKNNNIEDVRVVKVEPVSIDSFIADKIVYEVKQTHGLNITLVQYVIYDLDEDSYYTIEFYYTQNETDIIPFFKNFISSLKKIK